MAIEVRNEETAVERFKELRDVMAAFPPDKFIRLVPSTLQEPSSLFRPVPAAIKVNPQDERDVYPMPGSRVRKLEDVTPDGKVCLHTTALERIGGLLGIRWLGTHFDRDKTEPYFVTAHVRAEWIDAVGERISLTASATCDYREGSIGAGQLGGGLPTARQFINERAEARARNRIVRKVTGMPSAFTKAELEQKAFVAVRWILDERQPDVRRAIIERGTRASGEVFGTPVASIEAGNDSAADEFSPEPIETTARAAEVEESEPEIPAAEEVGPKAPTQEEISAIAAAALSAVAKRPEGERAQPVDDGLLTIVGTTLRDVLHLEPRVDRSRWPVVRLAILRGLFGVTKSKATTAAQARVVAEMGKEPAGQQQLARLFTWLLEHDATLAEVRAELAAPEQQTLAAAGEVLGR